MRPPRLRLIHSHTGDQPLERIDAWRVETWVSPEGERPWLAASAIVDSMEEAQVNARQSVAGLITDGVNPQTLFVGVRLGMVPVDRAGELDPGWEPHQNEPVSVAVIDDGGQLGLWVREPQPRWQARTWLPLPGDRPTVADSNEPIRDQT